MTTPRVGKPVRGSRTGRPIMVALDLLGRRGALRVLWELRGEPLTFRALQEAASTNPALLNTRLAELREASLVDHGAATTSPPTAARCCRRCNRCRSGRAWAASAGAARAKRRTRATKTRASA